MAARTLPEYARSVNLRLPLHAVGRYAGRVSRRSLRVAIDHGQSQPAFSSAQEAGAALFRLRDDLLSRLGAGALKAGMRVDYSPDSLKGLERWSFDLYEKNGFGAVGFTKDEFQAAMRFYLGETAVREGKAEWFVEEHAFAPGRWEIGVRKHLFALMMPNPRAQQAWSYWTLPGNKTRTRLFRDYRQHFT